VTAIRDTSRDTSPPAVDTSNIRRGRGGLANVALVRALWRSVGGGAASGGPRYCSKRCRQAPPPASGCVRPRRPATARALRPPSARARCPAACDPRRAIAQSAAGRPRLPRAAASGRAGLRPPERCALPLPGPDAQRRATRGALLLKALPAGPPPALGSRTRTSQGAKRARRPPVSSSNPPGVSDVSRDVSLPCRDAGNAARRRLELVLHVEEPSPPPSAFAAPSRSTDPPGRGVPSARERLRVPLVCAYSCRAQPRSPSRTRARFPTPRNGGPLSTGLDSRIGVLSVGDGSVKGRRRGGLRSRHLGCR
jgi:hypothetical protein